MYRRSDDSESSVQSHTVITETSASEDGVSQAHGSAAADKNNGNSINQNRQNRTNAGNGRREDTAGFRVSPRVSNRSPASRREAWRGRIVLAIAVVFGALMLLVGVLAASGAESVPEVERIGSAPSETETESAPPDLGGGAARDTEDRIPGETEGTDRITDDSKDPESSEEGSSGLKAAVPSERGTTASETTSAPVATAEPKYTVEFRFYDRDPIYAKTDGGTVRQILADAGYTLDRLHVPTIGADEFISYDATVDVLTLSYEPLTVTEEIPFSTEYVYDDTVPSGQSWETQAGVVGYKESMYTVEYINGQENYRSLDSEYVTSYPVNQIITVGTKPAYVDNTSGVITAADGTQYHYSKVLTVKATYYNLSGNTHSGIPVSDSVIATDPSVIPLGTKVYLKNDAMDLGVRLAADTGVYGNWVDVWMNENSPFYSIFAPTGVWEMTCYILD